MPSRGPAAAATDGLPSASPIDSLLEEALALAEDARDWLAMRAGGTGSRTASLIEALVEARETSRLTSRAAHCVAWLLARKALAMGEIDSAQAAGPAHRLGDRAVCLDGSGAEATLPPRLVELLERSERLYRRIDRLDRMLEPA
jgi:regulator of CtrA degradation